MDEATRQFVRDRAKHRCEYCLMPQAAVPFVPFHVEHVIAKQHQPNDAVDNLALACDRCNAYKGPNLSSVDLSTNEIVLLFHPRRDNWDEHFELVGSTIVGRTPTGRVTARLLMMNQVRRVELRSAWIAENGSL